MQKLGLVAQPTVGGTLEVYKYYHVLDLDALAVQAVAMFKLVPHHVLRTVK
jgi:hypothetical protein